jgi:hypothetical protein
MSRPELALAAERLVERRRATSAVRRRAPGDVPIAQDAVGDQWLLRDDRLWQLASETGAVEATGRSAPRRRPTA